MILCCAFLYIFWNRFFFFSAILYHSRSMDIISAKKSVVFVVNRIFRNMFRS